MSNLGVELPGKRLELLKEAVPESTRIAVLGNPADPAYAPAMHTVTVAAQTLGLHLHVVELRSAEELDPAFAAMTRAGVNALLVLGEPQSTWIGFSKALSLPTSPWSSPRSSSWSSTSRPLRPSA